MQNIQPILQTLTEALLRKLGDEVDLIFQYGSHLRGNTHQYSDVDISYVPVHEATGVMLACERQDIFALKSSLFSLLHELSRGIAQADTGFTCSGFNGFSEYEQDLAALGFPPLLPYAIVQDFAGLHRQCLAFDRRLQTFLSERSVSLNCFATLDELQSYLGER